MSATGRMWRHNWRLDFSVGRFAIHAENCPTLNASPSSGVWQVPAAQRTASVSYVWLMPFAAPLSHGGVWRRRAPLSGFAKKCKRRCAEQPVEHFPSPENRALVLARDRAAPLLRAPEEWSPANEQAMLLLAPVSVSVAQVTIACLSPGERTESRGPHVPRDRCCSKSTLQQACLFWVEEGLVFCALHSANQPNPANQAN